MRLCLFICLWFMGCAQPVPKNTTHPTRQKHDTASEEAPTFSDTASLPPATKDDGEDTATKPKKTPGTDTASIETETVDCGLISAANSAWEVCEETEATCAGVYTDGAGCQAFCAAAGLVCEERYGGEPGCHKEPENVIDCDADNGHTSDWCTCGSSDETSGVDTDEKTGSDCESDPSDPPVIY